MGGIGTDIIVPVTYKTKVDNSAVDSEFSKQTEQYPIATSPNESVQDAENLQSLNDSITHNTDSFKGNTAIMKEFGNVLPEIIKNFRYMNNVVAQTASSLPAIGKTKTAEEVKKKQIESYERQNLLALLTTGSHSVQALSGGNVAGAGMGLVSGAANAVNTAAKIEELKDMEKLSKGLLIGGGALMAAAAVGQGAKAMADSYKNAMPTIFGTGKAFGTTDDRESMRLYRTVNSYNDGTGLDIDSFNSVVQNLRKQGVGNEYNNKTNQAIIASQIAETTSKWAYATGGNAEQYANLAGLMSRYGGSKNVSRDFDYLVSAGKASGLNDTQIPEFLSGIQKVMEDGIAKGFSRSATEVADTMLMFSKLSGGNPFWQGEQGARLLSQANAGIASATGLNKSEDMLVFAAMSNAYSDKDMKSILSQKDSYVDGANYVNTMQMIERGITPENFDDIMNLVNTKYGSEDDRIEALRKMTGLNYTGASMLYNLDYENLSAEDLKAKLKEITDSPDNKNKETRWKEDLNTIAQAMQTGGEKLFGVELAGMDVVASGVNKLVAHFVGTEDPGSPFSSNNQNEDNRDKKGLLTTDYEITKAEALEKASKLPKYKQALIKAQTSAQRFEPGLDGSGWSNVVDKYSKFDITKGDYDSPMIEKVDSDDAPWYIKTLPPTLRSQAQRSWADEKGYKVTEPFSDDASVSDMVADFSQTTIKNLLARGKVSQDDFMEKIENSAEVKDKLKEYVKSGYIENKEQMEMSKILEKIYAELAAGITVTNTK